MPEKEKTSPQRVRDLTDRDFYDKACAYFTYHAEQRTTMINYFIAVYGACIALYGTLLEEYSAACIFISTFMLAISYLFYKIDLRTRFDIKKSENVIRQIERDYGMDKPEKQYPYGVFSNETNIFNYYGREQRREKKKEWKILRSQYKEYQQQIKKGMLEEDQRQLRAEMDRNIKDFIGKDETVSIHEVYQSLNERDVVPLSTSIKLMYYICMFASMAAIVFACVLATG